MGNSPLSIAIAGLGTVGGGTLDILRKHGPLHSLRCGRELKVGAVSSRDKNKARGCDIQGLRWVENSLELADDPQIDVIVESYWRGGWDCPQAGRNGA